MSKAGHYLPTSLQGIALKAKRSKKYRFESLHRLLSVENLKWCFYKLRKDAAVGVDGVTWKEYGNNLEENLGDLVDRLKKGTYRARLVKRKYIPKVNGKMRPLGIPSLEDKVVQYGVSKILSSIYEEDFLFFSYGYRPNIGAQQAVKDLTFELQFRGYGYIVEADIKGFFDNLDHDWMLKMLKERINDKALLNLIQKWLKAGILDTDGALIHPVTGSPQGGIVSPVLSNIYLHYALDLWFHHRVNPQSKGRAFLLRYADDFVAGFQLREDADNYYNELASRLEKFGLEVEPSKTNKIRFSRFHPDKGDSFDFLGFNFKWITDHSGKPRVTRTTMKSKFKAGLASFTKWIKKFRNSKIKVLMSTLKAKLRGTWNYYGVRGNFRMISEFWRQAFYLLLKWLNRRSQRKSYTAKGLYEMLLHFKIPPPRITETPSPKRKQFLCSESLL